MLYPNLHCHGMEAPLREFGRILASALYSCSRFSCLAFALYNHIFAPIRSTFHLNLYLFLAQYVHNLLSRQTPPVTAGILQKTRDLFGAYLVCNLHNYWHKVRYVMYNFIPIIQIHFRDEKPNIGDYNKFGNLWENINDGDIKYNDRTYLSPGLRSLAELVPSLLICTVGEDKNFSLAARIFAVLSESLAVVV